MLTDVSPMILIGGSVSCPSGARNRTVFGATYFMAILHGASEWHQVAPAGASALHLSLTDNRWHPASLPPCCITWHLPVMLQCFAHPASFGT